MDIIGQATSSQALCLAWRSCFCCADLSVLPGCLIGWCELRDIGPTCFAQGLTGFLYRRAPRDRSSAVVNARATRWCRAGRAGFEARRVSPCAAKVSGPASGLGDRCGALAARLGLWETLGVWEGASGAVQIAEHRLRFCDHTATAGRSACVLVSSKCSLSSGIFIEASAPGFAQRRN